MNYSDWKAQRERIEREIELLRSGADARLLKLGQEQVALDEHTLREYQLSDRVTLVIRADWFYLRVKDESRMQEHHVDLNGLTLSDAQFIHKAIKQRDRWREGTIDELPPSGDYRGRLLP